MSVLFNCLDRQKELKKLNHSLLINFLELLDILVNEPTSPKVKLANNVLDCVNIFQNFLGKRPSNFREVVQSPHCTFNHDDILMRMMIYLHEQVKKSSMIEFLDSNWPRGVPFY